MADMVITAAHTMVIREGATFRQASLLEGIANEPKQTGPEEAAS